MSTKLKAGTASSGAVLDADTTGILELQTGSTPTTAITVDASQNVGIGTASPSGKLQVEATQNSEMQLRLRNSNSGSSARTVVLLGNDSNAGTAGIFLNSSTNTSTGGGANSLTMYMGLGAPITFETSATERMRIDSSGNLLVGTTTQVGTAKATFAGNVAAYGYQNRQGTSGANGGSLFNFNWTGSLQAWIDTSNVGTVTLTSDYRIKRNIETQTESGIEKVLKLRPVTYQMADYGNLFKASDDIKEGFIAHEVQEVIPSGAEGQKDEENRIQSLRVDAILSVAVKAIQEQQAMIEELKTKVAALETSVASASGASATQEAK